MMWSGNWGGWEGALVMSLTMLLFWGGLILLVVYGIRHVTPSSDRGAPARSAIQVLEERFARGEIDRDEFEERRRVLESKAP